MTRRVDPANINQEADLPLFQMAACQGAPEGRFLPPPIPSDPARARDECAALALEAEARKHELAWAIKKAARSFREFTSDEVRDILKEIGVHDLDHHNALGGAFLQAAEADIVEDTGRVRKSVRKEARCRKITVWRSKLIQGSR